MSRFSYSSDWPRDSVAKFEVAHVAPRLPNTGPGMRVAGLRGGVILVLFVGLMGRLPVVKVVDLLAG